MAKPTAYSKAKDIRKNRILGCGTCQGNPNIEESTLQGRLVRFCGTCMEVINWVEPGQQIPIQTVTNEKVAEQIKEEVNKNIDIRTGFNLMDHKK